MSRADEKLNPLGLDPQKGEDLEMLFSAATDEVDATPPEGLLERLLIDIPQDVSFEPISSADLDDDNWSCDNGACINTGCNVDDECEEGFRCGTYY